MGRREREREGEQRQQACPLRERERERSRPAQSLDPTPPSSLVAPQSYRQHTASATAASSVPCMSSETFFHSSFASPASLLPRRLQHSYEFICWPSRVLGDGVMAAVPQTLQLTKAAQKQKRSGGGNPSTTDTFFSTAETDQPARYNSKLMNSIWGRYNEHSVHNFKSLQCGQVAAAGAHNAPEVGQALLEPHSPSFGNSSAMKRRLRELGEAVSTNFMDNLNQY